MSRVLPSLPGAWLEIPTLIPADMLTTPTRVRIVDALSRGERCVFDIATLVGLSESAVSHQLRLLRGARLVRVRRSGRHAYYSLDDHHVVGLIHDVRRHVEEGR